MGCWWASRGRCDAGTDNLKTWTWRQTSEAASGGGRFLAKASSVSVIPELVEDSGLPAGGRDLSQLDLCSITCTWNTSWTIAILYLVVIAYAQYVSFYSSILLHFTYIVLKVSIILFCPVLNFVLHESRMFLSKASNCLKTFWLK